MKKVLWFTGSILLLGLSFNVFAVQAVKKDPVTFTKNVLPVLQTNCASCHPGVVNYDIAYAQKEKIVKKITSTTKQMPPKYATRLTESEVEMIKKWVETGAKK